MWQWKGGMVPCRRPNCETMVVVVVWGTCAYNCEIHVQPKLKFNIQHAPVTKEKPAISLLLLKSKF